MDLITSRAIIGMFYEMLEQGETGWVDKLTFGTSSDQDSEKYAWLGQAPAMREMKGGRQAKGLSEQALEIINKEFEATLKIKVKDLRRDKTGQLRVRIGEMADRANAHWARLVSVLVNNGASQICYDGQYFFDTDHSEGDSGVQSNAIDVDISTLATSNHGSISAPSVGEASEAIMLGIQQVYGFKDDTGEPINENARNFLAMVPTNLWKASAGAANNAVIDGGDTNTLVQMDGMNIEVVANPRLTANDKIRVFRTDGRTKPFIRQEEVPVEVSAQAEGSDVEFKHKEHHYGLYASGNAGFGMWQHGCEVTLI